MTALFLAPTDEPPASNWIAQLASEGWTLIHTLIPDELTKALNAEARLLHTRENLERARHSPVLPRKPEL